jgi:linoleoyl-CoA desaturase
MVSKKIKFSPQNNPDFINELRAKVKDYFDKNNRSKYGNASIVLKSVVMFTLYLAPLALILSGAITSVPFIIFCWIIMGIGMAGVGMGLMHDANHSAFSKNQKVNKMLSNSMYLLGGFPANWQYQHNTLHHGFTNIDGHDQDIDPAGILRFSPHKPLYKIHKLQFIYAWFLYGLMTLLWVTTSDFNRLSAFKKMGALLNTNKSYDRLLLNLVVAKILYYAVFMVIPVIFVPVSWYWIVTGFLTMHFVSGFILSIIFQTAHVMPTSDYPLPDKQGNISNNWAIHQLMTTSDYSPKSRIFSWFIGGLNFQVVHHLFPNISHVHYKGLSVLVKATAEKYNLPYHVQPNFVMALLNHGKMLRMLGREG